MVTAEQFSSPSIPLYQKDLTHHPHQVKDYTSAVHFFYNVGENPPLIRLSHIFPEAKPIPWEEAQKYSPKLSWFAPGPDMPNLTPHPEGVHGIPHLSRVPLLAITIGRHEGLSEEDLQVVAVAAGMHDVRRVNDIVDLDHGKRTALWAGNHKEEILKDLAERGIHLTDIKFQQLQFLCMYHEGQVPEDGFWPDSWMKSLKILRDADALDRFRIADKKWWTQKELLHYESSKALLPFAKYFCLATEIKRTESGNTTEQALRYIGEVIGLVEPNGLQSIPEPSSHHDAFAQQAPLQN